jgi:hypothetical protein
MKKKCLLCKTELVLAGSISDKSIDGYCPECQIYYSGEEAKAIVRGDKVIQL